jgi:hypothetical protein
MEDKLLVEWVHYCSAFKSDKEIYNLHLVEGLKELDVLIFSFIKVLIEIAFIEYELVYLHS